jgi:parallel beta-helix repeat protein
VQGASNSLRWNETSGNGFATGPATNFGIGILATAMNNLIEANSAIGNSNGIVVFPGAGGNQIRQNLIVGNPPIQVSNSVPNGGGVDIWDQSTPGTNFILGNMCVTAINAPCPNMNTQAVPRKPGT